MESQIQQIINVIPDLVVIFNSDGKVVDVSQKVLEVYNNSDKNSFIGRYISDFVVLEQHNELQQNFEELKMNGYIEQHEYKLLKADGSYFYGELTAKALEEEIDGDHTYITIIRDITPQKTLLDELNKSKMMFQHVLDNIPQFIFWKDKESKFLGCNENFARVAGFENPEDIVGKTDFDLAWKFEEAESFFEIDRLVMESGMPELHIIESQLQADGKQAWLDVNRIPLYDSENKNIGLLGTYEDITERKINEMKIKESERKFRNIVENSLDGISLTNEQGEIIEWNQGMEEITGFLQNEVLGRPVWEVQFPLAVEGDKTPEMKEQLKNGVLSLLKKGDFPFPNQIREQEIQCRDGTHKILQTSSYLIKTDHGKMIGTIMRDISNQKIAEKELNDHLTKLEILNNIIKSGNEAENLTVFLEDILDISLDLLNFHGGGIYLTNDLNTANMVCSKGLTTNFIDHFKSVEKDNPLFKSVFIYGKQKLAENLPTLNPKMAEVSKLTSIVSIPFLSKGEVIGAMNLGSKTKYRFSDAEKEIFLLVQQEIGTVITKIKTEEKLRESEERFKALFKGGPVPSLIFRKTKDDFQLIDFNNVYQDFSENSVRNILYHDASSIFRKRPDILKDLHHCFNEKVNISKEVKYFFNFMQEERELIAKFAFVPPDLVLIHAEDITKKKESDLRLKESEEKYRNLFEDSPYAIGLMDMTGKILDCNSSQEKIFGYEKDELIGKDFRLIHSIPQKFMPIVLKNFSKLLKGEPIEPQEIQLLKKDGSLIWVIMQASLIKSRNETLIQAISQDITIIKEAELKLKESEEKFRSFADQSLLGINIIQNYQIKYINKAYVDIFGYTIDKIIDWGINDISKIIYPDDREFALNQLAKKQRGDQDAVENYQFRGLTKLGEIIWLDVYSKTINYEGKPADFITIIDITEKKAVEEKMRELDITRKDLITRISHELRTPLTSIYGVSQILLKKSTELALSEEIRQYLDISHRGTLRLKELVENLLDASRLDNQKLELRLEEVRLKELLTGCIEELFYLIKSRDLIVNLDLPNEINYTIDQHRLSQAIINLLSNAIKNTPPAGEIYVKLEESNDFIDIVVGDTGVGITKEEKQNLFQKFGKIERYGQNLDIDIEGAGLGLYISKEIVELHGGQILVESEGRNKGTTFIIRLFK